MIQAGVGRVTITPPVGTYLMGFAKRQGGSRGVRDDLYATAIALSDGVTEVVIVSCDLLMIHPDLVQRVRRDASAHTGIPGAHMMFCATHCHSGPVTHACPDSPPLYRSYVDHLAYLLSGVIQMAHHRLAPASLAFQSGRAHIGVNRRLTGSDGKTTIAANFGGARDPELAVLRIDKAGGEPLAMIVNHACHAVVLGPGSNVVSADWPGVMRQKVEAATGATCLYLQGACADVNPLPGAPSNETMLTRLGTEIGGAVIETWARAQRRRGCPVRTCREVLPVPLRPVSEHAGQLPPLEAFEGFLSEPSYEAVYALLNQQVPWTVEIIGRADRPAVLAELQAMRFGDVALVTAAAEIFSRTGIAIKRQAPLKNTMVAAYTNGSVGYLAPREEYRRGGYEVEESHLFYRLPAPVAPEAAGLVEQAAQSLLNWLMEI
jgi:hypothetical protein